MQYRNVGKAGIKVSEIALGSWMTRLEDTAAVENAAQIVRKAWDAGVNFFDCADAYSGGDAEIFLGRVLKEYPRDEVVVSSKVFFPTGPGANQHGLSRKHILAICRAKGIPVVEEPFTLQEMMEADEVFFSSSSALTCRIGEIDGKPVGLKDEKTFALIRDGYQEEMKKECGLA